MKKKPHQKAIWQTPSAEYGGLIGGIAELLETARRTAARTVNALMTATYWEIGRRIVEFEQRGEKRAVYGEELLRKLSTDLVSRFGRGFLPAESAAISAILSFSTRRKDLLDTVERIARQNPSDAVARFGHRGNRAACVGQVRPAFDLLDTVEHFRDAITDFPNAIWKNLPLRPLPSSILLASSPCHGRIMSCSSVVLARAKLSLSIMLRRYAAGGACASSPRSSTNVPLFHETKKPCCARARDLNPKIPSPPMKKCATRSFSNSSG